jgi:hypothetical protein
MYLCAIVQTKDGKTKEIECNGYYNFPFFLIKLSRFAKKENKLVKIVTDNWKFLAFLRDELPDVPVYYGFKEGDQLCIVE